MVQTNTTLLTGKLLTNAGLIADGAIVVRSTVLGWVGRRPDLPFEYAQARVPDGWDESVMLLPGLVDIHCHGGAGGEMGAAGMASAIAYHREHGTTSLLGSIVSARPESIRRSVSACAALVASGELAGIHLEGPFLSEVRCGAQNPHVLMDPDLRAVDSWLQSAADAGADGAIKQMTWAPERRGGRTFGRALRQRGILAAMGHTDCTTEAALAALQDAGLVTHIFNGMPRLHHRAPGPAGAALAAAGEGLVALEVIGDGEHLAPATVSMLFDLLGPDSICLITDAMSAAGLPDGNYTLGGMAVQVTRGAARLSAGGSLAGGTATLLDVVRWTTAVAGVPLVDAVRAASEVPARRLGLDEVGMLEPGRRADVLVTDDQLKPLRVLRAGVWV